MKNELQVIDEREILGKRFRVYGDFENLLFLAKDVAEWIDYAKTSNGSYDVSNMLKTVDEDEKTIRKIFVSSKMRNMWFLTEDGFYEVCMQSTKPNAKIFKKEVKKILKTIRKTGMYMTDNVWDTITSNPEKLGEVLINYGKVKRELEQLEEENQIQKQLIAEYKPIKEYVDTILSSEDTMTITQIAADYGLSAYELNKTLNEQRVIRKVGGQWILYAEHMNKGYTKSETITVKKKNGTEKVVPNTKWTQKGRLFVHNLLETLGIKANMDREKEGA
ncbi:phage antirepressor [Leptotrichia wadei]|uniref:phage antirepressor n=1 Tax=Leptotrichia wadei TaxID=157687 RepID=UPI0028E8B337|nr:phage antirepressor KilAC domain-containing protein [Leptotrichia wadei]